MKFVLPVASLIKSPSPCWHFFYNVVTVPRVVQWPHNSNFGKTVYSIQFQDLKCHSYDHDLLMMMREMALLTRVDFCASSDYFSHCSENFGAVFISMSLFGRTCLLRDELVAWLFFASYLCSYCSSPGVC